jgi:hypothetical protein
MLTNESITFGKYRGNTLGHVLKDRSYCKWLLEQDWFQNGYEYLYNRVKEYEPQKYFLKNVDEFNDFIEDYQYFNLYKLEEVELPITEGEKLCYGYYIKMIDILKDKIYERMENDEENPFDIKAPTNWLKKFEKDCGIPRNDFKEFLSTYDLPNIPYIVEDIKKEGGIEYKGAKSFLIAKARSEEQEKYWEEILKSKYGEHISTQYKYEKCIFDFINILTNTIFECKLSLKDFNEEQHTKYRLTLNKYRIIYLISRDCVINMERRKIYTTNSNYYSSYIRQIVLMKESSYLDKLILEFDVVIIENLYDLFGNEKV